METKALAANDVRVLVSQLNDAIKQAAEQGLEVRVQVSSVIEIKGRATCYPFVSARIWTEVK